jgi:hypothetical protein
MPQQGGQQTTSSRDLPRSNCELLSIMAEVDRAVQRKKSIALIDVLKPRASAQAGANRARTRENSTRR